MEEAKLRIQQMEEEAGFKIEKKEIPPTEINTEEPVNDHHWFGFWFGFCVVSDIINLFF